MTNRKDDHITQALHQNSLSNDFDRVRFVPEALARLNTKTIDTSRILFGRTFDSPVYINAMSGGSERSLVMNTKLAKLAAALNIPMASGSVSAAIKDPRWEESFTVIREHHPNGFVMANVGLSQTLEGAKKAIKLLKADALQVHLNAAQEIVMPEGDRDFSDWPQRLQTMVEQLDVPVIVKEVGFGLSRESLAFLSALGVQYVDVSGRGGTNFITIENARRRYPLDHFDDYGFSTVESLLEGKDSDLTLLASGGVRGAFDVVKAIALGAKMVGMSGFFLKMVHELSLEECIEKTQQLLQDIRMIMAILNVSNLDELAAKPLLLDASLQHFLSQRSR